MKNLIYLLLASLFLVSCGKKLTEGTVTDKTFTPAHSDVVMMPMTTVGPNNSVSVTMIPMFFYYPDTWSVQIEQNIRGKCLSETWYVSKEAYSNVVIGGWFKATSEDCTTQPREKIEQP